MYAQCANYRQDSGKMAGTIQQIAEIAGVSRGTVDRALNDRGRINPEVKERILHIANEIGYVPRKKTGTVKAKRQIKIGVVTQLAKASFMVEINRGIAEAEKELAQRGVVLCIKPIESVDEEEQLEAIEELQKEKIDALAIMPVESERVRQKLNGLIERAGIPVVTFNADIVGTSRSCFVGMDNKKSGQTAAGLMGMLTGGRGKVLIITGFFSNNANSNRVDGFIETIKQNYKDMEVAGVFGSYDDAAEVERIIVNVMTSLADISGIFVVSGGQAGIERAFDSLNLQDRPKVIVYDLIPNTVRALKQGVVDFLIDQEGYEQGYRAPMLLADMLLRDQRPVQEFIYTDISIKTKYNIM